MAVVDGESPDVSRQLWRENPFNSELTIRGDYPLGYVKSLDGIRGLMTLGVMAAHTRYMLLPGAVLFMDLFFVMSGYLITSLLIADYQKRGSIDFKKFYVRRFLRLYPALIGMLAVLLIVAALFSREFIMRCIDAAVAFLYISDYWRAFEGVGLWYTVHTWSLSIEEQFYLLWPIAFLLLLRRFELSWPVVACIVTAACAFALWRAWLAYDGATINRLYNSFDTRADALLIGCAVAVALKLVDLGQYPRVSAALVSSQLPLALVFLFAANFVLESHRWYYYASPFITSVLGAVGVAAMVQHRQSLARSFFELAPFVFCGRICYGLYIWHFPVFNLLRGEFQARYIIVFLVGWPIVFALAIASYFLIERRFMRARPI
jgi:peptidoglycan/LPS O-acetylase OafA/YrhL